MAVRNCPASSVNFTSVIPPKAKGFRVPGMFGSLDDTFAVCSIRTSVWRDVWSPLGMPLMVRHESPSRRYTERIDP